MADQKIEGTDGPAGLPAALVERVARALAKAEYWRLPQLGNESTKLAAGFYEDRMWRKHTDAARTALTASGLEEENRRLREALEEIEKWHQARVDEAHRTWHEATRNGFELAAAAAFNARLHHAASIDAIRSLLTPGQKEGK